MSGVDMKIYKAVLSLLKDGCNISQRSIARQAGVHRKTIYNKIEKYTFQDLEKYKKN